MSIPSSQSPSSGKRDILDVFQKSVSPSSKGFMALHPHFYDTGLYNRASELKALDELVFQTEQAAEAASQGNYGQLPHVLDAIKDTLSGKPQLSWWNLFAVAIGNALSSEEDEEQKNEEEFHYLTSISNSLTAIIRSFQSTNTKLLLETRLTALEVDSRLVELEKMPKTASQSNETQDYLSSEFKLLNRELQSVVEGPKDSWKYEVGHLLTCIEKANQLLRILHTILQTNPDTYQQFCKKPYLSTLEQKLLQWVSGAVLISEYFPLTEWDDKRLGTLFELFAFMPPLMEGISLSDLCTLLIRKEELFVKNEDPEKIRPSIFSSSQLIGFVNTKNDEFKKLVDHLRIAAKDKSDRSISANPVAYFKSRLCEENDLHNICAMLRFQSSDHPSPIKDPSQIQRETLFRMKAIANCSQPKDLDQVLKSVDPDLLETRYFLAQEVMLEQFIFWRKNGIF